MIEKEKRRDVIGRDLSFDEEKNGIEKRPKTTEGHQAHKNEWDVRGTTISVLVCRTGFHHFVHYSEIFLVFDQNYHMGYCSIIVNFSCND